MIPTDPEVRQDYWFERCRDKTEESHLLGLFKGLLLYHFDCVPREELGRWREDSGGNAYLVKMIIEKFNELPETNRGAYFPWFLEHRTLFELLADHREVHRTSSPTTEAWKMADKARKYLAAEDQRKDIKDLHPLAKSHCFVFYSIINSNAHPPPLNQTDCYWFDFGFVICRDQHEESRLGSMYNTMLFGSKQREDYERSLGSTISGQMPRRDPSCSFDEFWAAWERDELMTIFDKCWPNSSSRSFFMDAENDTLDRLRMFFDAKRPRPSIWKLRHFLALGDLPIEAAVPEIAQAARHYGICENLETRTVLELKDFYSQLLDKTEALAIHEERMRGTLLQFAQQHIGNIDPRVEAVLQALC